MAKRSIGSVFMWIIMALLAVSLVGFGVVGSVGSTGTTVASVGDSDVTMNDYDRNLRNQLQRIAQQTGTAVSRDQMQAQGIDRAVLFNLVSSAALGEEGADQRLGVSDETLRAAIEATEAFQGANDQFDPATYRTLLNRSGYSPSDYEDNLRADELSRMIQTAIQGGDLAAPEAAAQLLAYANEQRSAEWAMVTEDMLDAPVTVDDADAEAYYEANLEAFVAPERRRVAHVALTPETYAETAEIGDEDVRAAYERAADYNTPEQRIVERLVFSDQAAADAAKAAVDSGEKSFDQLLEEAGLTPEQADLGAVRRNALGAAAETVFALTDTGIAGPVETDFGPALFRVNAIIPANETPLEEVEAEIRADLAARAMESEMAPLSETVNDMLAGGATLEEVADETALTYGETEIGADDGEGIATDTAFRIAAENADLDFPTDAEPLTRGGIFALQLLEVIPEAQQSFDEVRELAEAGAQEQALAGALTARAEEMVAADALPEGAETVEGLTRNGPSALPEALKAALFEAEPGTLVSGADGANVAVARLTEITPFDGGSEVLDQVATVLGQARKSDLNTLYIQALQRKHETRINQANIDIVLGEIPN
ncbi:SurA N-terminal domain-containing protein [Paracoccaceae bacterium GXU_MW_L88]